MLSGRVGDRGKEERGWTHPILCRVVLRGDSQGLGQGPSSALSEMFGKHLEILFALPDE